MLKKINWGWGLGISYTMFVAFMLFMVWRSTQLKTELVSADYYGDELKYQQQLNKMKHANSLRDAMHWAIDSNKVLLQFPEDVKGQNAKAEILFYKPDNSSRDFKVSCKADSSGKCTITSEKFRHGVYRMQVDWSAGKETYYSEGLINMN